MASRGPFLLSETYRNRGARTKHGIVLFAVVVALMALLIGVKGEKKDVDSHYGKNCTQQLHCGSQGLICMEGICNYCLTDTECRENLEPLYRCNTKGINTTSLWLADPIRTNQTQKYGVCTHKLLFKPFHWRDFVTSAILFIGSCIAAGSGVGGGGLNVALIVFINKFDTATAIPLSSVMIGGAAVANFLHALPRRRDGVPRPLIDYHTILLLQPLMMGGSVIGILLNRTLPDWLILLVLIVTLVWTCYTTLIKFIQTWRADKLRSSITSPASTPDLSEFSEKDKSEENGGDSLDDAVELEYINGKEDGESEDTGESLVSNGREDGETEISETEIQRRKLELREQKLPLYKLLSCFGILIIVTVHSIFLGGKGGPSLVGIRTCTVTYWLLMVLLFPVLLAISWYIAKHLVELYYLKRSVDFEFLKSDIEWTPRRTYAITGVAFASGSLSSMLGIGGGMLINPLLLHMGVAPDCSAATSSLMILFTSISSSTQYALIGRIQWDYAFLFLILGLLGSVAGQHVLGVIVKRYKSQAYILLAMLLIIVPGGILLIISTITGLTATIKAGSGYGFKQMCSAN